ncbi:hypothetical protein NJB1604_02070 [Mycobacterium marinum]|uniref:hypothetical protein n=1 Tax=Mycobacterium marinum TaxID=1781 RepID=UPI0021C4C3E9|nr:hypothetical protein [Mycobacterium marinum]GJO37384.1 hypothetical protein NJB1604_02070 [Mycobacterium marinum]
MTASQDKTKAASALYQQIAKEVEELAGDSLKNEAIARLDRLETVARIYAYVAEAPVSRAPQT